MIYKSWKDMPLFQDMDSYLKLSDGMEHIYQYNKKEVMEVVEESGFTVIRYEES